MELARTKDKRGFNTYLEAAFGCSMEQIEPRFQNYLGVIRSRWKEFVYSGENGQAFRSESGQLLRLIFGVVGAI
jgi:hypothetical protein